jgi:hypothetical protein
MPCLVLILALAFPRVVLVLVFLLTNYLQRAYATLLWPLLGFIFLPLTTLVYAWVINTAGVVDGIYLAAIVVAALIDLGSLGAGSWRRGP